ncbi:MAG: DNA mismatch repair endonuclease MutL [Lachnospiraceae bacterium]|nr:DNA mismatch repair endonuclease MutL [Lachnospiraceae bacterium]
MAEIHVLDDNTIDKIAAGEVVERPSSVVKELVENAMDAGATAITVEIKEGGIEFIRVTDNGGGIERTQVRNAFLRHATSKISQVTDLQTLQSLGFRGEALSSIAAVSKVEIVTKTSGDMTGIRYCLEGGRETEFEEVGAPDGTTFIVRNLFFNTPVRRKFLKTAMTEGSYITDLLEHLALSKPEISFKYVLNGQTKFFTNGDGDLKAIIYRIFGRDIANEMMPFQIVDQELVLEGFLGKPTLNRANRNFENYFVNGRFVKSKILSKAIEEGYQSYLMQHRYPFCVIHITVPTGDVDVNVHPTKMEVRFSNQNSVYRMISQNISEFLATQEMIPEADLGIDEKKTDNKPEKIEAPEPFEKTRMQEQLLREESSYNHAGGKATKHEEVGQFLFNNKVAYNREETKKELPEPKEDVFFEDNREQPVKQEVTPIVEKTSLLQKILGGEKEPDRSSTGIIKAKEHIIIEKPEQLNFFDEKILTREAKEEYRIIGQVFETYWIIEYRDKLLIIDQHAAHEKVKYEQILKKVENHEILSQTLTPPIIISVTPKEADIIHQYNTYFEELGFQIEDFGMNAYAIRGIPYDLFGYEVKELFETILTEMSENPVRGVPQIIREKIASMACKAAVKGNNFMTYEEADTLIEQLLSLENPYNCPHGRPTIVTMSKYEMEKKFKRIV